MNITIDCDCGNSIDTKINKDYDVLIKGENGYCKEIECINCGSIYRVRFMVDIIGPPTKIIKEEDE
jgi:hypothetical protein